MPRDAPIICARRLGGGSMWDVIVVGLITLFFLICLALVRLAEKLR
jgi:hypothetical protein